MPGIVGLITKRPVQRAARELALMVESLVHERFYLCGSWTDEATGVYVGWVERAGSFSEGMPLKNERGNLVLVFSGEEFPATDTVHRLRAKGHEVENEGPSYLVHLSEEDRSFPSSLNGRFHGLLCERNRAEATLFNDRYGMHRLYYYEATDAFYFAAEAKAILAVCPELRTMDFRSVGEFVACGAVLENRSLFRNLHVLPPGSAWSFHGGLLEKKSSYFRPSDWEQQEEVDPETFYSELREVFVRNLPRYFQGSSKIAMSLTGGLDTRMILAHRHLDPLTLPCYTFGSMYRENSDVRVARKVAQLCHQQHLVITAGTEFLAQFPRYAERSIFLTDGCVDVGRASDLYLNERAREIAPVRMTGNYGSEVLRGVRTFKPVEPVGESFSRETLKMIQETKTTYTEATGGHPVSFAAFKQAPWHLYGVLALEQTQLSMRSPFLDNELVRTIYRSPAMMLAGSELSLRLISDGNPCLSGVATDRGLSEKRRLSLPGLLSRGVQELLFKAEYAYDMGMPQWMARVDHAFAALRFERVFLGRHKPVHFRIWYRDHLAAYVRDVLLDSRSLSRPYVNRKGLENAVLGHLRGDRNYTNEIHKLLSLELLHRLFMDNSKTSSIAADHQTVPCIVQENARPAAV